MKTSPLVTKALRFFTVPALLLIMFAAGCEIPLNDPVSSRFDVSIRALDSSLFTTAFQDSPFVAGADVFLVSLTYGTRRDAVTDSSGYAVFDGVLPGSYAMAIHKTLPESLVEAVTGSPVGRALNGRVGECLITVDSAEFNVWLTPAAVGDLVISEIYYNGAPPNPPYYFHDQFTELYNNSDSTIYLDSLIIADAQYGYIDEDVIHSVHAYMFPGTGHDIPLLPGEMIIIAQDAIDHSAINPNSIDLRSADFEYYVRGTGDVDNPAVPNMIQLHHKYGNDFLYSVMNDAIAVLKTSDPYARGYDDFDHILLPVDAILDAVEYREDPNLLDMKKFPSHVDAGITGGMPMYRGKSIARYIDRYTDDSRAVLRDNNNSTIDFHILDTPTPGAAGP